MRPRPWLLLCVSLHGVAASKDGFPSGKHGLDYCIAEASTHHRHDSVDRHGTSNNMWDAIASLAPYMPVSTNVAGMCEYNPIRAERCEQCIQSASSSPFEPTVCFDNPFLEILSLKLQLGPEHLEDMCASTHTTSQAMESSPQSAPEASFTHGGHFEFSPLRSPLQVHPWPNSPLGSMALPIMGHGISATTQPHSWLATCVPPPTLLGHPILSTPEPSRNGTFGSTTVSSRLVSDMSGAGVAEPLSNGIPGKELAIYSGPQWYYKWLQSADNSTDGDTRHDLPWIREVDNAAAALCLDYLRRHGKGSWIRDELHWNYLFSNKNCARVWSVLSGIAFALLVVLCVALYQ